MRRLLVGLVLGLAVMIAATGALAASLTFQIANGNSVVDPGTGGLINAVEYAWSNPLDTRLYGVGINVTSVSGVGTPVAGTYNIVNSALDFMTDAPVTFTGTPGISGQFDWATGLGVSQIALYGDIVDGLGNPLVNWLDTGIPLLAGYLTSMTITESYVVPGSLAYMVSYSAFMDNKNPDMLALFGLPYDPFAVDLQFSGSFAMTFFANDMPPPPDGSIPGGAFQSTYIGGGTLTNVYLPEAGTMMLLGSGLIGLAAWGRKKFRK